VRVTPFVTLGMTNVDEAGRITWGSSILQSIKVGPDSHFLAHKLARVPASDQISDPVLDTCMKEDPNSKVACETAVKDNMIVVLGEITTHTAPCC